MNNPEELHLQAIEAAPREDAPRVAYAASLGANDSRARYLRAEVALHALGPDGPRASTLRRRMLDARATLPAWWLERLEGPGVLRAAPVPFAPSWFGFGLGEARPCAQTYEHYSYDAQPRLSQAMLADDWSTLAAPPPADPGPGPYSVYPPPFDPRWVARAQREVRLRGYRLPRTFLTFLRDAALRGTMNVPTHARFELAAKLVPIPGVRGARLLAFFTDSQSCGVWNLCLVPSGGHCVVYTEHAYAATMSSVGRRGPSMCRPESTSGWRFAAPTFRSFIQRMWLESRCWFGVNGSPQVDAKGRVFIAPPPFSIDDDPACSAYLRRLSDRR